ncbi:MAG TPA: metal-sensitive transcriptional regulator [Clostridia bacterium]
MKNADSKADILKRLNRIEGQVKGIHRMIEEEKACADILTQVAAVRAAINKVGGMILESHSKECMINALNSDSENKDQVLDELIDTIQKFLKFVD